MIAKQILTSLLALVFLAFNQVVIATETTTTPDAQAKYTYTEDKLNIMVTADHPEFSIKLKSNPTTGYSWFLREYNSNLITPVKHSFQKPTNQNLMGAPGYELWTFRVKPAAFTVPQQSTLRMIYARPWQTNDSFTQLVFRVSTQGK